MVGYYNEFTVAKRQFFKLLIKKNSDNQNNIKSGLLVSGMSTVWLNTNSCAQQYMFYLDTYLITVLSSLYGIIMYCAINAPGNGNNVVDVMNATDKRFSKGKWNFLVN